MTRGVPDKLFSIDCPPCESYLRGDGKPKKLVYQTDPKTGQVLRQERVPDSSDQWASTPDTVPLTPDEERTNAVRSERGRMQIEMLQALAALRSTGVEVPPEAMWLLERELPSGVLRGTVVCAQRPRRPGGPEILRRVRRVHGRPRSHRAAAAEPEVDLGRLHVATLRKRCRDAGLPDKGSKDALIGRLQAA